MVLIVILAALLCAGVHADDVYGCAMFLRLATNLSPVTALQDDVQCFRPAPQQHLWSYHNQRQGD